MRLQSRIPVLSNGKGEVNRRAGASFALESCIPDRTLPFWGPFRDA
jgi:hypothetical protein